MRVDMAIELEWNFLNMGWNEMTQFYMSEDLPLSYPTLNKATDDLQSRGYRNSFRVKEDYLHCNETDKNYAAGEVKIINHYRFEGFTNPSDQSAVYAIECADGEKGLLVIAYGPDVATETAEFLRKIDINEDVN